jgi:nucleotide-binding universal stress UspA family protein
VLDEDAPPVGATEALLQLEGLDHEVVLGNPAQLLMDTAITWGADLIVMGSEGKSGLGKPFFGSVAEWVVRESPIPVLTVRAPLVSPVQTASATKATTLPG